ncbi:MAG: NAD+ synthase [Ignavibacteria bacterium]|nr:NAD+ synthase [Ignavibacteria bacterium]
MNIVLASINPIVGDLKGNYEKIISYVQKAKELKADLIIFPELSLLGYPPLDLLDKNSFVTEAISYHKKIVDISKGIGIIFGSVTKIEDEIGTNIFNSAIFCYDGKIKSIHHKSLLPNYDVFDEVRYFEPSKEINVVEFHGKKLGITICEDAWNDKDFWVHRKYEFDPIEKVVGLGADIIINISASPFSIGKEKIRTEMFSSIARKHKRKVLFVNQVGANTDLIFDGGSKVFDSNGNLIIASNRFEESLVLFDTDKEYEASNYIFPNEDEDIYNALILGIRDYCYKTGFRKVVLGLSGGIDSALVAVLAKEALGADNVLCVMMPSKYSSEGSIKDAQKLIENIRVKGTIIPIQDLFDKFKESLSNEFKNLPEDVTEENLQSRIRGVLLMALSNKFGYLLLATGNKSELATGYATLYGDMCGGLAPISDVYKTKVYDLARFINRKEEIIPVEIINKVPSAELKPNQTDQDTLPPYEVLDKILYYYIEEAKEVDEIVELGFDRGLVQNVLKMVDRAEYKRKQAAPGLKITSKAFGTGRRFPIVQRWR